MSGLEVPAYAGQLSPVQRERIYAFVDEAHRVLEGSPFIDGQLSDGELLALGMWISQFIQIDPNRLNKLFATEFGISIPDEFHTWLAATLLLDVEDRIRLRAGGRN